MGKAADNERLKLRANFYNNCSVGALVGGLFIPLFGLYTKGADIGRWYTNWRAGIVGLDFYTVGWWLGVFGALVFAFAISGYLRILADREAGKIQD